MVFAASEISQAFAGDEFFPVFQPIVELRTGQLAGFEILARWKHPRHGIVAPDEFIPAVETSGLIDTLTRTLLEKAFSSPVLANSSHTLAVNVSAHQLLAPNGAGRIAEVAERYGFALDRLIIEITESALLDDLERAQAAAGELKALHCKLALDDFGTGYSSLKHLHALPFDELKVDRSFVISMTQKRESRKIVAAVVGLGQSLGTLTVAEGVETQEQANMLLWLGCDMGQGWLYGKPVPADELPRIVAEAQEKRCAAQAAPLDEDPLLSLEALPTQRLPQLQAIYDGAPVGLCFLDRNLRYVSINKRLAQMNGLPASAHIGRTVAEVIPHLFPRIEAFLRRALQGEPVTGVEVEKPPSDACPDAIALLLSYRPARDEAGEVLGVSVAVMDVTRRKRTEAALRESENHFRHMMWLSPHVPWVLNDRGEVTDASPRWESFTGQKLHDALGMGWLKALHPDDVQHTESAIRNSLSTGGPIDVEYRVRRPGGEWIWMRSRGSPRFGPSGEVVSIYGVVEEVHHHKETSEELETCFAELQAALYAVPVGVVLADAQDQTIFMVNPVARKIFGNAVFPGQRLEEYSRLRMIPSDGKVHQPEDFPLARAIAYGESVEGRQVTYEQHDSAQVELLLSSKPIYSDDHKLIGGLLIVREIEAAH